MIRFILIFKVQIQGYLLAILDSSRSILLEIVHFVIFPRFLHWFMRLLLEFLSFCNII